MIELFSFGVYILILIILVASIRLLIGPTIPDRVVALDTINTLIILSMIILGVIYKSVTYIDVAIVYALLSYIAVLYLADYIGGRKNG